ncbi:hypothetical protein Tco_0065184 [Tanacetum coccineum]
MDDLVQDFFIRPEGNTFDLDVYGETCFVDYVNRDQFTDVVLNSVINSLGYEMEDEVLYWYKIPLKSLDVGLKPFGHEEDNIEVLEFDSLESDLEDVPENDRRDVAKDLIRTHAVESRRNLHFLRNDPIRIRVVCNGVVPCKNLVTYKVPGPNVDNAVKGKIVNEDAEEDKITCPWLLYLSKGDKGKWFIKTFKDEHHCLQSRKIKYCTSTFLSKHITYLIIMNPNMPIKAIQEQMQKKFHVVISRDKAFRAKAKVTVSLRGDVKIQYALLRDYVMELKRCNPDTTVKIDVYGEEDPESPTRPVLDNISVLRVLLKKGFREGGGSCLGLDWCIQERTESITTEHLKSCFRQLAEHRFLLNIGSKGSYFTGRAHVTVNNTIYVSLQQTVVRS